MTKLELAELRPVSGNLLSEAKNQLNQINESEMSSIKGGIDLEESGEKIISILGKEAGDFLGEQASNVVGEDISNVIGETSGDVVTATLGDIFL